jgi:uncharacterized protein YacL
MNEPKQALPLVVGSVVALIIAAFTSEFVFYYPSVLSVFLFVTVVPVFATLGIGFFLTAREEFIKSKLARRPPKVTKEVLY